MRLHGLKLLFIFMCVLNAKAQTFEAEDGTLQNVVVDRSRSGYSGTGYVTGFEKSGEDAVVFNVELASAGFYQLSISYASPFEEKFNYVFVNQDDLLDIKFPYSEVFRVLPIQKVWMSKGVNQVKVVTDWGYIDVDYLVIEKASLPNPSFEKSLKLVATDASAEAIQLMNYLTSVYGKKIISGQQENDEDFDYIEKTTGRVPALKGFDLLNYSSAIDWDDGTTPRIIEWFKIKNGIPTVCWHWFSPSDQKGPKSFYITDTDFDVSQAVIEGTEEYDLVIKDIDAIAAQLKIIQKANVPILWRPLHEASYQAFWWGSGGPDVYKKLYEILFRRLNDHHRINNLIWVWTSGVRDIAPEWYPGDERVDIVGADIYINNQTTIIRNFDFLVRTFTGKLVPMSENGLLPDPDVAKEGKAYWSWFCTWGGKLRPNNRDEDIIRIYNHEDVITLDELPKMVLSSSSNASSPSSSKTSNQEKETELKYTNIILIALLVFIVLFLAKLLHVRLKKSAL